MKKINFLFLSLICWLAVSSSCTIEKRLYNKGFHVEWNKKYKSQSSSHQDNASVSKDEQPEMNRHGVYTNTGDDVSRNEPFTVSETDYLDRGLVGTDQFYQNQAEANQSNFSSELTSNNQRTAQKSEANEIKTSLKQQRKEAKKLATEPNVGSSQLVALILVILVGVLGIHRFYLGYYGIGILMLLTFGFCGILALVDLIRIAVGDLKPKYGEYTETL